MDWGAGEQGRGQRGGVCFDSFCSGFTVSVPCSSREEDSREEEGGGGGGGGNRRRNERNGMNEYQDIGGGKLGRYLTLLYLAIYSSYDTYLRLDQPRGFCFSEAEGGGGDYVAVAAPLLCSGGQRGERFSGGREEGGHMTSATCAPS